MDNGTRLEIQEHVELEKEWRWIPLSQHWICGEELFLSIMIWLRWMKIEWYWCDGLYNQIGDSGACGIGEVLKMNSILESLDLSGRVIFMYYDLIEMNEDWMILMWWIMESDWRFRSMWDWRRNEDEFHSHKIGFGWRSYFYALWFDWDEWGLNDIYVMDYITRLERKGKRLWGKGRIVI